MKYLLGIFILMVVAVVVFSGPDAPPEQAKIEREYLVYHRDFHRCYVSKCNKYPALP